MREIIVTFGNGEGATGISAFDKALWNAGIANYNLIKLSSVIPKDSIVVPRKVNWNNKKIGHKLYSILSECRETVSGKEAWAGLGWVQTDDGSGLFAEGTGSSKNEVIKLIKDSIDFMIGYRDRKYGIIGLKITGIKCKGSPVSSLVCAILKCEKW